MSSEAILLQTDDLLRPPKMRHSCAVMVDLPELGLGAGEVGAVVEVLGDGKAREVEFCDNSGVTDGLHTLRASQIVALHSRGHALRLRVEVA